MSFVKHTWTTGETITAALMNRIENAIEELEMGDEDATPEDCDALFDNFLEVDEVDEVDDE